MPSSFARAAGQERIVAEHPHFQADGARGHGLADAPQTDDAQRLAGQLACP